MKETAFGWVVSNILLSATSLLGQCADSWPAPPAGFTTSNTVRAIARLPNGNLVVGGSFQVAGNVACNRVALWNGTTFAPLGGGLGNNSNDVVQALTVLPNGDIVAGGKFLTANNGTTTVNHIARWNGATWTPLGSGFTLYAANAEVTALLVEPSGTLFAVGYFTNSGTQYCNNIARWTGTTWVQVGSNYVWGGGVYGVFGEGWAIARAVTRMPNGDLVVGGGFEQADNLFAHNIARWTGSSWQAMGAGVEGSFALLPLPNGQLLSANLYGDLDLWNGTSWVPHSTGPGGQIRDLELLPNGDILAVCAGLYRYRGNAWQPVGVAFGGVGEVMQPLANGDILLGGTITNAGGRNVTNLATLSTTCPATAASVGSGCVGSGGMATLSATSLPWLGTTFRSRATGLGTATWGFEALGFQASVQPLSQYLPQAAPGCTLQVQPSVLQLWGVGNGTLDLQVVVPNAAALVGVTFLQQVVSLELDPQGTLLGAAATNALRPVLGDF